MMDNGKEENDGRTAPVPDDILFAVSDKVPKVSDKVGVVDQDKLTTVNKVR